MPAALETPSLRDLARQGRVPALVLLAVAVAVLVLGGRVGPLSAVAAALDRVLSADPAWALAAAGFEVLSFAGYIALTRHVTALSWADSYRTTLAGAAATRLLPTAGAGGAALTLWVLKRRGRSPADLLAFLVVLYAVFLAALLGASLAAGLWIPAGLAAAAMLAAPFVPKLSAGVRAARALVLRPHLRLLGAPAWWAFDCAVLWAAFHAVGAGGSVPVSTLAVGYFVGQAANTIPLPGAASGGMIGVFIMLGVSAPLALAAVATYRAIAIWLPAPLGAHALAGLRRALAVTDCHAPQPLAA